MENKRNTAIDAMRFIFMCILCPFHCPAANLFPNGYIAVEFFFILAGFFIYQSYKKHSDVGTIDFTLKKMGRFLYPLLISIVLLMLLDRKRFIYPHELTPDGIVSQYFLRLPELLFCQGLEFVSVGSYINVTLWFISILIFGGALIYSLLKNFGHKTISIILPLCLLLGITYMTSFGECGLLWRSQLMGSPIDCNLMRGVIEMGIGVLLAYIFEQKKELFANHVSIVNIFGIIGFMGLLLIALAKNNYDTLSLFLIPMLIVACVQSGSIFSKAFKGKVWRWLGEQSMYIYFIHSFVSAFYYILASRVEVLNNLPVGGLFIAYLSACLVSGIVLKNISDKLYRKTISK